MRQDKMKEAKAKAGLYCAYQERTHQEVRSKLYALGLYRDEVEQVLTDLITENFVNEERFAKAFAGGKFRIKHWGRRKIIYALKRKNISTYCIQQGLREISEEEYIAVLKELIERKSKSPLGNKYLIKQKISSYLIGKGFESELVSTMLDDQLEIGF